MILVGEIIELCLIFPNMEFPALVREGKGGERKGREGKTHPMGCIC